MYTPLKQTYGFKHDKAIAFIGTADPWSDVPDVIRLSQEQGVSIDIYDDANHSLETKDTLNNLEILKSVMKRTYSFLRR